MRTIIYAGLMAAVAMPAAAYADPAGPAELRRDRQEIRQGRHEVRQGQNEVRRDVHRGDWQEAREDRREVREDRRDAWKYYRARNREVYHRPAYVGPRGYRYQAWRAGARLPSAYYGPRYVIADPWHYRLNRPAAGYLRWVRYGDDVLLVDIRNGVVRDVIHDFFW